MRSRFTITLVTASALLFCAQALAIEDDLVSNNPDSTDEESEPLWEVHLAAFARYGASYPASDDSQLNVIPIPYPVYRGKFWRLGDDRENPIRGRMFSRERLKLDIAFDLNFSVDSDDVAARIGMPDLDLLLEVGPELEYEFRTRGPFDAIQRLALQLKPAVSFDGLSPDFEGFVFSPEYRWNKNLSENDELKLRVTPSLATSRYMDFFYTVEPIYATANRPAFSADGGYLGTEIGLTWVKTINKRLEIVLGGRVNFHQGATNDDSPLYTSETTYSAIAAFTWKFWESERRATSEDALF